LLEDKTIFMQRLISITEISDIPEKYRDTPIGSLLEYHNLGKLPGYYQEGQLLVGMCMDNRKRLRIPNNFCFIIRTGGGNLRYSEFKVSYAIAMGGIRYIALIGHTQCAMVNLHSRKEQFVDGLVNNAGWDRQFAEDQFNQFAPLHEIGNEVDFVLSESTRLRNRYPKITVVPMIYKVEDNMLYLLKE
jgi:carbonic anhydrase